MRRRPTSGHPRSPGPARPLRPTTPRRPPLCPGATPTSQARGPGHGGSGYGRRALGTARERRPGRGPQQRCLYPRCPPPTHLPSRRRPRRRPEVLPRPGPCALLPARYHFRDALDAGGPPPRWPLQACGGAGRNLWTCKARGGTCGPTASGERKEGQHVGVRPRALERLRRRGVLLWQPGFSAGAVGAPSSTLATSLPLAPA